MARGLGRERRSDPYIVFCTAFVEVEPESAWVALRVPEAGYIGCRFTRDGSDMTEAPDVTQALIELSDGDRSAMDRLLPMVYDQLRNLAQRELRRERSDHTLSPTALVHEAYLKLVQLQRISWRGRAHFFGASAGAMRRILISYARMKKADKRGAGSEHVPIDSVLVAAQTRPADLMALDEALTRLEAMSERQARIIECRFFAGMSVEETAEALDVSPATVKRDWTVARAWLNRELQM